MKLKIEHYIPIKGLALSGVSVGGLLSILEILKDSTYSFKAQSRRI